MMSIAIVVISRTFVSGSCGQHVFIKLWNCVVNHLLNIALNKISF